MPFDQEEMDFLKGLTENEIVVFQQGFEELKEAIEQIGQGGYYAQSCNAQCQPGCAESCLQCSSGGSLKQ
jgi:hypothetical protein